MRHRGRLFRTGLTPPTLPPVATGDVRPKVAEGSKAGAQSGVSNDPSNSANQSDVNDAEKKARSAGASHDARAPHRDRVGRAAQEAASRHNTEAASSSQFTEQAAARVARNRSRASTAAARARVQVEASAQTDSLDKAQTNAHIHAQAQAHLHAQDQARAYLQEQVIAQKEAKKRAQEAQTAADEATAQATASNTPVPKRRRVQQPPRQVRAESNKAPLWQRLLSKVGLNKIGVSNESNFIAKLKPLIPQSLDIRSKLLKGEGDGFKAEKLLKVVKLLKKSGGGSGEERKPFWRRWIYTIFFSTGLFIIWAPVVFFVSTAAPVYNSTWTILIPGTMIGTTLDLSSMGRAHTEVKTPYGGSSFSPGVNYKAIMSSVGDYGTPKIKVTDQAATLAVVFSGESAEDAQARSTALYHAFHDRLDALRADEVLGRKRGSLAQLEEYREQANEAMELLADFRDASTVVSADQYSSMVTAASELEDKLLAARVGHDAASSRLLSMADTLGIDAHRAADVMLLRQDKLVQTHSTEYARLQAAHIEIASNLGRKHPKVVQARARADGARESMIRRIRSVIGHADEEMLASYIPDPMGDDGALYKDVVTLQAEREASARKIESLENLLAEMRGRIAVAGSDLDELEKLERASDMANAILVSATSNLDMGQSNIYATYPMTQVLVAPTLPEKPKKLLQVMAIIGGILGTLLMIISIIVVKFRDKWRRLILKKKSSGTQS